MARHTKSWNAVSLVVMAAQATQLNICPAIVLSSYLVVAIPLDDVCADFPPYFAAA
jgi:hypothetical protein